MRGHDFLAQATARYRECIDCGKRTPLVCVRCGYCYSCHPKVERAPEQVRLALA